MYVIKTHVLFFHTGAVFTQYPSKKKVRRPIKHPFIPDKEESVSTREVEIHICGFFLLSLYTKATLSKGKRSARQESQVQLSGPYSHSLPPPPPPLVSASLIWYPRRPTYLSSSSRTISSISFCLNGNREPAFAHTRDHTEFLSIFALIFSGCVIIASQSLSWTLITLWELRNVHTRKEKYHLWDSQ